MTEFEKYHSQMNINIGDEAVNLYKRDFLIFEEYFYKLNKTNIKYDILDLASNANSILNMLHNESELRDFFDDVLYENMIYNFNFEVILLLGKSAKIMRGNSNYLGHSYIIEMIGWTIFFKNDLVHNVVNSGNSNIAKLFKNILQNSLYRHIRNSIAHGTYQFYPIGIICIDREWAGAIPIDICRIMYTLISRVAILLQRTKKELRDREGNGT